VRLLRPVRRSRLLSYIPYSGLMRWHYITGVIFGIFTLTWVFSGLLSMDPWEWVSGDDLEVSREPFTGGSLEPAKFPAIDPSAWTALLSDTAKKEVELHRIQGEPYYVVRDADANRLLVQASPLQLRNEIFSADSLLDRLKMAAPDANIVESSLLSQYDGYYYPREDRLPLPV